MRAVVSALCLAIGCGGGSTDRADAGPGNADAGGDAGQLVVMPPAEPAPPTFEPCPAGWRARDHESGVRVCDPWPEGGRAACTGATAHFPGGAGCEAVGSDCPTGEFAAIGPLDPGARAIYVRPGATAGDGSLSSPYGTIAAATRDAAAGDVILLGKGAHDGLVFLEEGVTLKGACAEETVLTWSSDVGIAVVNVTGANVSVQDVSIAEATIAGVDATGATTSLDLAGVLIAEVAHWGIGAFEGAEIHARDVVVRDVASVSVSSLGVGVASQDHGTITVRRAVIERTGDAGLWGIGAEVVFDVEDVAILSARGGFDGIYGHGLRLGAGARGAARRIVIEDAIDLGVILHEGATAEIEDILIEGVRPAAPGGETGTGVQVQQGSVLTLRRARVEHAIDLGLYVGRDGAEARFEDVLVWDTPADETGSVGRGLAVDEIATATGARVWLERNRYEAIRVEDDGVLDLEDLVVRDTSPDGSGSQGYGLVLADGIVRLTRARIERVHGFGIIADGARSAMSLEDVTIREIASEVIDGEWGRAISVQSAATAEIARALFVDTREVGVAAIDPGTTVTLSDVVIERIHPKACAATTCTESPAGLGIAAVESAAVSVSRFSVRESSLCGVLVARDADLLLRQGEVIDNPIGACVQVAGFDLDRLTGEVVYRDNGTNLDTTELPVPSAGSAAP